MSAQITLTQQSNGIWTASIVEADETITFTGASASIHQRVDFSADPKYAIEG